MWEGGCACLTSRHNTGSASRGPAALASKKASGLESEGYHYLAGADWQKIFGPDFEMHPWLQSLDAVEDVQVADLIDRVPESEMSGPARAFAQAILQRNKWRILRAR